MKPVTPSSRQSRGAILRARGVGVNIEQARDDHLAAGVDRDRGVAGDLGLDGGDAAAGDGDVADGVEPEGRVDDAAAPDDEIEASLCGKAVSETSQQRRARGDGPHKLTPVHRS